MSVRVKINGKTFLLSMDEFLKLIHRMTSANPVNVLDFVGGRYRGERQRCRSPLFFSLWVRSYRDNCNLVPFRTIKPKNPVCSRGSLLSIRLENFFTFGAFKRGKFVSLQTGMPWILG